MLERRKEFSIKTPLSVLCWTCVTYMAPEIIASSRRDIHLGWPLHMVSVAKTRASNLDGTEVPGSILGGLGRIFGIRLRPTPRESGERLREWGGGIVTYMAPEITASSRRDTGFGWPLQHAGRCTYKQNAFSGCRWSVPSPCACWLLCACITRCDPGRGSCNFIVLPCVNG